MVDRMGPEVSIGTADSSTSYYPKKPCTVETKPFPAKYFFIQLWPFNKVIKAGFLA